MLSARNIDDINRQISRELDTVKSWASSVEDKDNALKRVAALKALLDEPTESSTETTTETYDLADLGRDIRDLIRAIRRS